MRFPFRSLGVAALVGLVAPGLGACTNILVTKGASANGSTMIAYSDDGLGAVENLYFKAGGQHDPDATRDIFDWESGRFHGRIPEAPVTYTRVGNMNEHQLVIGESTFGGRDELAGPSGMVDYGSLIYITLERTKTAREAIRFMTGLVDQYGYASTGESFSIADPNEVWMMEMIGKGKGRKGAVWVAVRIPDGTIAAHANQARIRAFPLDDPENCLYSKDVIAFARDQGYFQGEDKAFSFARAYAPLSWAALRNCERRVWSIFNRAAKEAKISPDFVKAVPGASPMPLSVKPDHKLEAHDVMQLMRDYYGGTEFDLSQGVGAGPYGLPLRCRPLTFRSQGTRYVHQRPISTCATTWSFVSQSRAGLPDPVGGLLWFGFDNTYTTCYFPVYCGIRETPRNWAEGSGSAQASSWDSAYWVTKAVSNWAYSRWNAMIPEVQSVQKELEGTFLAAQGGVEAQAGALYAQDPEKARSFLTDYTARQGALVYSRYKDLFGQLVWKYTDFGQRESNGSLKPLPFPAPFLQRIADADGDAMRPREIDPGLDR